jgi:hypothetical protein
MGKAGRVAFGKAIFAKALDLVEAALGKLAGHSRAQPCGRPSCAPICADRAAPAETSPWRGATIGLVGGELAATMAIFIACS